MAAAWPALLPSGNGGSEGGRGGSEHQCLHFCLNLGGILSAMKLTVILRELPVVVD